MLSAPTNSLKASLSVVFNRISVATSPGYKERKRKGKRKRERRGEGKKQSYREIKKQVIEREERERNKVIERRGKETK